MLKCLVVGISDEREKPKKKRKEKKQKRNLECLVMGEIRLPLSSTLSI